MTLRLPLALLAGALAISACDSGGGPDPVNCAVTPDIPECQQRARNVILNAAYDTTGTEVRVTDNGDGIAPGGVTWTSNFTYILTNKAFVNNEQELTIEAGTVVKGEPGLRENATALIVARGGTIQANGTAASPIVMTALADDVTDTTDEPQAGSWGGLLVLGTARTNTTPGVLQIEGIATNEPRGAYGCGDAFACDDASNSGTIRYVSIRYGGAEIGEGNEINGLTMGAVGSGTTIEYVEVFRNLDDGFEWFGGTVNTKHLVSAFNGDEQFDTDQGYRGLNQYLFGIHDVSGDNGFEMDGGDSKLGGEDAQPASTPVFYNVTSIGFSANRALRIRESSAPKFFRSIFTLFDRGVDIQQTVPDTPTDSESALASGALEFMNNVFGVFNNNAFAASGQPYTSAYLQDSANGNQLTGNNSSITAIGYAPGSGLNPTSTGPALTGLGAAPANAFFENSSCIGAVCPGDNWIQGWTALSRLGYLTGAGA